MQKKLLPGSEIWDRILVPWLAERQCNSCLPPLADYAFLCLYSGNPGKTFLCSPVLLTGAAAAVSFSASMPGKCPVVVPHSLSIGHSQSQTYLFLCTLWLVDRSFQSGRESHMPFIEVDACIYKALPFNGPLGSKNLCKKLQKLPERVAYQSPFLLPVKEKKTCIPTT